MATLTDTFLADLDELSDGDAQEEQEDERPAEVDNEVCAFMRCSHAPACLPEHCAQPTPLDVRPVLLMYGTAVLLQLPCTHQSTVLFHMSE